MPQVPPNAGSGRVLIVNPPIGFRSETSMDRARRFVRKGRAEFVGPAAIRFLDTPGQAALEERAEVELLARITGCGYDQIKRVLMAQEIWHVPVIGAAKMIRREKSSRDWSFAAAVSRHSVRSHTRAEVSQMRELSLRGRGGVNPQAVGLP